MKGTKLGGMTDAEARVKSPIDYGKGRVCLSEGCATIVSRYNPLPFCSLHEDEWYDEPCEYNEHGERQCKSCDRWWPPGTVFWTLDKRMKDGLSPVCRHCRRHPKRPRSTLPEESAEAKRLRAHAKKLARDQRYRDRKRAEGR